MNVDDSVSQPSSVALSTLANGDGFFLTGKHYVVVNKASGACFCFEDCADVGFPGTTQVFRRTIVEVVVSA